MKHLKKLTLLHSNDMHGDFLAENVDNKLIGGVSRLSGYVSRAREEEPNTIYAIAGDMFRGSVIDSEYQGISTIEIMNLLAPDVVTLGNHETDYGVAHLLFIEKCAKFPIINANFFIRTNHARLFRPYVVIERGGMKVLFIGVITQEVLSQTKNDGLIGSFIDIGEAAAEIGRICNTYRSVDIDLTVLLTHIGFEEDKALAAKLDPAWGVDLIIGGHSHSLPDQPAAVNGVLVVQAGTGTDRIGRFDIQVDTDNNCVDSYEWRTIPIDAEHCPRDEELERLINTYKTRTDAKYSRVLARLRRQLTHPERNQETELGNLLADLLKDSLGVDLMLLGSGSIRSEKLGPIVRYSDFIECFPYDDPVYMLRVTAAQLRHMLLFMLRDEAWGGHTEFYQLSRGFRLTYSKARHELLEFTVEGREPEEDRLFSVGLQEFHYANCADFFDLPMDQIKANGKPRAVATSCRDIMEECLCEGRQLDSRVEGRLNIVE